MRRKFGFAVVCSFLLANCTPVSGPKNDATTVTFKSDKATAFVAGYQPVIVKITKENSQDGLPADCRLDSTKYSANFTSPATLNLPGYSKGAVNVKVTCEYEGEKYEKAFAPVNLSKRARNNSAVAVGVLLCPICGVGMAVGNAAKKKKIDTQDSKTAGDIYGFTKIMLKI